MILALCAIAILLAGIDISFSMMNSNSTPELLLGIAILVIIIGAPAEIAIKALIKRVNKNK